MLSTLPPVAQFEPEPAVVKPAEGLRQDAGGHSRRDGVYFVEGEWLLKLIATVNFDDYESLQYFQRVLINTGVIDALREAASTRGDTVSMYDLEFDLWSKRCAFGKAYECPDGSEAARSADARLHRRRRL